MFMVHLQLPRAPVSGSIIFVDVLLKLGGYGLIRVFPVLFKFGFVFRFVWISLRLRNVAPDDGLKSPKHVERLMINKDPL